MKKSFLMIIGCLMTVALVFNACTQQENLIESPIASIDEAVTENSSYRMTLPSHLAEADADEVQQFIESLSPKEIGERIESSKILNFLKETGKLDRFVAESPDFDYLTQDDLEKYAGRMLSHYASFVPKVEGARGCIPLYSECNGTTLFVLSRCCFGYYCDYSHTYYFNHPDCTEDLCYGVTCPPGQTCNNGVCSGPILGDCNPPCTSGFCDNGLCCGGNTGVICP